MGAAPDDSAATRLAALIEDARDDIERRWLARVQQELDGAAVEPTRLRDGLPDYLKALAALLRVPGQPRVDLATQPAWTAVAREHGITRVRIGFDVTQLVHEFIILRQTIRGLVRERGIDTEGLEAILADALDAAISAAVSAYVDVRDYQARRKQAENVGFLTHELRNPLSAAMLNAAQLRKLASPEQTRRLDSLDRSHRRLSALIDGVLLNEKLESGHIERHPVEIAVGQLVEPSLEAARGAAAQKGLAFDTSFDAARIVRVDPALTRSAIANLVDNAVKFTDVGGVEVAVEDAPGELVVHVRDTCAGISPEELRTIFEPFERGTTGKSGTGLGLAIAKRAVEAQRGAIGAESPDASGCHFWLRVPFARAGAG